MQKGLPGLILWEPHRAAFTAMQREAIRGLVIAETATTRGPAVFEHILAHGGQLAAFAFANPPPPRKPPSP